MISPRMEIAIRKALPGDAGGIARVHVESWRSAYRGLLPEDFLLGLSVERRAAMWTQVLTDPQEASFLFVAVDPAGEILGFVSAGREREGDPLHRGEVQAIYLMASAQRGGLGRRLMQAAAGELRARGFTTLLLWVLKDNQPARRFYEALGGTCLREKPIQIGSQILAEVAYGWSDLTRLTGMG